MRFLTRSFPCLAGLLLALLTAAVALPAGAADAPATHRLIVRFKAGAPGAGAAPDAATERSLGDAAGTRLRTLRAMSGGAHVLVLPARLSGARLAAVIERLQRHPRVAAVLADQRETAQAIPNDPQFAAQWHLQTPALEVAGVNAPPAWDRGPGAAAMPAQTIAIIDSGVRYDHPDIAAKLLPGFDFIGANCVVGEFGCTSGNQFAVANDGDGRDADASDPGDWVSNADRLDVTFAGCPQMNSRWHGTRIAGLIGAATNNGLGIAGVHWSARLLPVRVLGKCGGYQSDVADGIRWAAGLDVPGVPVNPHPARVINIGVGSPGACADSEYAAAIADVLARGVIVVASAGNEDTTLLRPANCPGVLSVGALRRDGARATYSNSGSELSLMAPGGNFPDTILSSSNAGQRDPLPYAAAGYYDGLSGTSFSAPLVSASAALMLSLAPRLTATQLGNLLRQTTRAFVAVPGYPTCVPGGTGDANNSTPCNCTTAACGAGMLDADAALVAALAAPLDNRAPTLAALADQTVTTGAALSFTVRAGDANGDSITLSAVQVPGGATFNAATGVFNWSPVGAPGNYTFSVRASDGQAANAATVNIVVLAASSGGGGGGGGSADLLGLALLGWLAWRLRSRPDQPL